MYLALGGAGANGTPADEISVELAEGRVEKLGAGRNSKLENIGEQLPSQAQALVDVVGLVEIRVVDKPLPADYRARLFEIDAHDHKKRIRQRVGDGLELGGVFQRGPGVVYGARA